MAFILLLLALALPLQEAAAGVLGRADVARRFPAPLVVGERDAALPVWPLYKQNATAMELVGYVFESVDLAPVPGFAGVPPNLLVALDAKGGFMDVAVLSHHEPVFLEGLGEAPLFQFVSQYRGLSLSSSIRIGGKDAGGEARLDGVAKATASVRIINQSVLSSALKVARSRLGFAGGGDPSMAARLRMDVEERLDVARMKSQGLLRQLRVSNREAERLFAGGAGAALDPEALSDPDGVFLDLHLAHVSVPSVGRGLLTPRSWSKLAGRLEPGDHALLAIWSGRHSLMPDEFVRGGVPDRLVLRQQGLPLDMRDLDMDLTLRERALFGDASVAVFRVIAQAGLDPGRPLEFALPVTRSKGIVYPERITRELALRYQLPERYYIPGGADETSWRAVWKARALELAVLACGLLVLAGALILQRRLAARGGWLRGFRAAYLLFTVGFIGYWAQAQLSIVNLTGAAQALAAGRGLGYLLFDPANLIVWAFVLLTLLFWGRGVFCGWLCPFGALQEFAGKMGRALRLPQIRLRSAHDVRLKWLKFAALGAIAVNVAIVASAGVAPAAGATAAQWLDRLVELEPFKTAITLNFVRSWPYAAYAVGLLVLGAFWFKFFCRYLCPLGAGLALAGKLRLLNWLPRRMECGQPCQTCRHRCDYQAIKPDGAIVYDECFQCLDCVVIHESEEKCAPLIMERKRVKFIPIARVDAQEAAS
ncbi:4Fe-4S binding protein [Pseudoduganella namucuonensis]|uniref:Regulator of nitric oxide reductase transcription n=1 Tax=Pseudoduganella namucuonensis TaxID=1035707 RepID=A0A1I7M737_9BURK|nr:4Fe-4S binding protein [Pseudoduganella namucuonensis]SFV17687.1 Regulator of nitric oxide reductase transcription [Pseudoduganella namucuonensis]